MVDVTAFAEDSFNAKRWINDACVAKPADDNIEKCAPFTSSLVRAQLIALAHPSCTSVSTHNTTEVHCP